MSEQVQVWNAIAKMRREARARDGVECPLCKKHRPRAHASILLPQQRCRVDGYVDPRVEPAAPAKT